MKRTTVTIPTDYATGNAFPLTDGELAMNNLQAQIAGQERQLMTRSGAPAGGQVELIELVTLRGQILGHISDYEWADANAEQLTQDVHINGLAFVARAKMRSLFHRFPDALADLDRAQQLGADTAIVDAERASIFQGIGSYERALAIYAEAAKRRADFGSFGALATLHAERGEIATAERFFDESQDRYRGVSPFPLALLNFRRGLMWLEEGELQHARTWFETATRVVPAFAPAQGHLAEVEAASGEPDAAIARLLPLTASSDDPDYPASLARILGDAGRVEEADEWRKRAAIRYDDLLMRHPEAFADHAAEFWLEAGDDAHRALRWARLNLEMRQTRRSNALFARATLATRNAVSGISPS
jgi:tetratricopeptide (TPR) repeat protein